MLKADNLLILIVLLLSDGKWEEPLSYVLAFFGAIAMRTGFEWGNNSLTKKGFYIRLLFIVGLSILMYISPAKEFMGFNGAILYFLLVFFCDILVNTIHKYGSRVINKKGETQP